MRAYRQGGGGPAEDPVLGFAADGAQRPKEAALFWESCFLRDLRGPPFQQGWGPRRCAQQPAGGRCRSGRDACRPGCRKWSGRPQLGLSCPLPPQGFSTVPGVQGPCPCGRFNARIDFLIRSFAPFGFMFINLCWRIVWIKGDPLALPIYVCARSCAVCFASSARLVACADLALSVCTVGVSYI